MSGLRAQAGELKFRLKLLVGLAFLGAASSAVLYLGWITHWQADLPTLIRLMPIAANTRNFQLVVGCGAFWFFWLGIIFIAQPWRDTGDAPSRRNTVKKPW